MPQARITAQDVARMAGVSQPTVSRVFTPGARVSPALAERVRAAARELGYRPNTLARSLITGRSRTIGLVVAYLDNPFYPEALERFSVALQALGYHILVFIAANQDDEIDGVVEDLLAHQVDGIVLASVGLSSALTRRIAEADIPFVLFNRGQENPALASVTSANYRGGGRVARYLVEGGYRRIAHISGWLGSMTGRERQAGFVDALAALGREPVTCIDGFYNRDAAKAAARGLMALDDPPDAIFVGNDHMAFAVLETLRHDMGLGVPDDVAVVGYDDVAMAAWGTYDLTTVRQPANRMVQASVDMLLGMIEGKSAPQQIEIDGPLMVRGSAPAPPGWED